MYTVPPNVYLYYYICYYVTDVTTLVVSLTGPLTATQHAELIQILEKRLAKGSQIRQDYLKAKAADTSPPNT